MKVGEAIAETMKRKASRFSAAIRSTTSSNTPPRRHPPDHRAPGAHRPAHGRRDLARHLGTHDRRLLHAARPGRRERLSAASRRLRRIGARCWCCRWAMRAGSPTSTPNFNSSHADARRSPSRPSRSCSPSEVAEHHAPRLHAAAQRPRRPGASSRSRPTCGTRRCRSRSNYTPVLRTRYGPDPRAREGSRATLLVEGQAAGDLCRPGRALRAAPGRSCKRTGRAARRSPVTTSLGGKSAFPENHPLVARLGRRRDAAHGAALPRTTPT